jgi:hypothetical protein
VYSFYARIEDVEIEVDLPPISREFVTLTLAPTLSDMTENFTRRACSGKRLKKVLTECFASLDRLAKHDLAVGSSLPEAMSSSGPSDAQPHTTKLDFIINEVIHIIF